MGQRHEIAATGIAKMSAMSAGATSNKGKQGRRQTGTLVDKLGDKLQEHGHTIQRRETRRKTSW